MFNVEQLKRKLNIAVGFSSPAIRRQVIFLAVNKTILKLDTQKQKFGSDLSCHLDENLLLMNILLTTSTPALPHAETWRLYQRKGPSGEQEETSGLCQTHSQRYADSVRAAG